MSAGADAAPTSALAAIRRAAKIAPALSEGFGISALLAVVGTAGQLVVPIVIQRLLDGELLQPGQVDLGRALGMVGLAAVAVVVALLATRAAIRRLVVAAARGLTDLRVAAFRHVHELSTLHVAGERRGALVARVTSDIETIVDFIEWGGVIAVVGGIQVTLALTVMFVYDWRLALLVLASVSVYAVLLGWFQRILARGYDRVRARGAEALAAVGEAIAGLPTIRAFGVEERVQRRVDARLRDQYQAETRMGLFGAVLFSSAELFAAGVTAMVVAAGVWLSDGTGLTAGTLVAFLFLTTLLIEPIQMLVETLEHAQTAAAGIRRALALLARPVEIADPVDGVALADGPLDVEFEHVDLRYTPDTVALRDVDVHIPAGWRVAVVGETGSGKTTFVKLATRLLDPSAGAVRVGGIALPEVTFASLRQRVAYVPQDGFLVDASIVDNVRYGRPAATDDEVTEAFRSLGLWSWVQELPEGLATRVGERGGRLSAGERQLVALARAWIAAPDLLVLDEATSAVDPALEVHLRRALERLTEGRTTLTVAHRLATAEAVDEVLVFADGRLVERGPHARLVAAGGVYAKLHADWARGTGAVREEGTAGPEPGHPRYRAGS